MFGFFNSKVQPAQPPVEVYQRPEPLVAPPQQTVRLPIVYLVRDGEYDPRLRDPEGTVHGECDIQNTVLALLQRGGRYAVLSSPLCRSINSALGLFSAVCNADPEFRVLILPDATEVQGYPCDLGTPRSLLARQYPRVNTTNIIEDWYNDRQILNNEAADNIARAAKVRRFLRRIPVDAVVLFSHAVFLKYLSEDYTDEWAPNEYRKYNFPEFEAASQKASLVEDIATKMARTMPQVTARIQQRAFDVV